MMISLNASVDHSQIKCAFIHAIYTRGYTHIVSVINSIATFIFKLIKNKINM